MYYNRGPSSFARQRHQPQIFIPPQPPVYALRHPVYEQHQPANRNYLNSQPLFYQQQQQLHQYQHQQNY